MGEPEPSIEIVPPSTEMFPPPRSVATPPEGGFGRVRGVGLLLGLGLCGGLGRGLGRGRGARLRGDRLSRYLGQQDRACDDRDADPLHELSAAGFLMVAPFNRRAGCAPVEGSMLFKVSV